MSWIVIIFKILRLPIWVIGFVSKSLLDNEYRHKIMKTLNYLYLCWYPQEKEF